jgi:MFS family permease
MGDYKNLCKATYLSLIFLAMYVPFGIVNNLFSEINEDHGYGNLGFIMLAMLYVGALIGSVVGSAILWKLGRNWTFIIGALLSATVAFAQILPLMNIEGHKKLIEAALIAGSVFSGFGSALIWIA